MNHCLCFIGTYTRPLNHVHGRATGIHSVRLCLETGALTGLTVSEPVDNTSYLCSNSTGDRLHAISEITGWHGTPDGCITTFAIAGNSLRELSQSSSRGSGPAYIRLDHSGRWLLCANYLEGNAAIFPVRDNGTLAQPTQTIPFTGGGPDPSRQQSPHPHAIVPTPDNRFVHIIDLGTDRITGHRFDHRTGTLTRDPALDHHCGPGKGPRHFLHHPTTRTAYCVLELSSEVQTCRLTPDSGKLETLQTVTTLPEGFAGHSECSELCLTRDGRHLYVANRGHDSIAIFEVAPSDGTLRPVGHASCHGRIPRHIALSPDDRFLLIANQESDQLVSLHRHPATGRLTPTGHTLAIGTPAFIEFPTLQPKHQIQPPND